MEVIYIVLEVYELIKVEGSRNTTKNVNTIPIWVVLSYTRAACTTLSWPQAAVVKDTKYTVCK